MDNGEVARVLREIGLLLELSGENPFKARAYVTGARVIEDLSRPVAELVGAGRVKELKGIGDALARKLHELSTTGRLAFHESLRAAVPSGLLEVAAVRGLGASKVRALWRGLGVASLEDLARACREGRVAALTGFGEKSQANILAALQELERFQGFTILPTALAEASRLAAVVRAAPGVQAVEVAGEVRRARERARTIEVLAAAPAASFAGALDAFANARGVQTVTSRTGDHAAVTLVGGLSAALRIVTPERFGAGLLFATGSRGHLAALTARAAARGLSLDPGGLSQAGDGGDDVPPGGSEEEIYAALGLSFVPPECREGNGEVDLAAAGAFPRLVERADLRGLLHFHTTWSDGRNTLREMLAAAAERGFSYAGVCDHSRTSSYAGGLSIDRVRAQRQEIAALQAEFSGLRIMQGIESDILPDGSLDYPEAVLAEFDFIVASVHSQFSMSREAMTARVIRAVENPRTTILGHPTGRLLLQREGYAMDMEAVLRAAARAGTIIELNANPRRLDVDWRHGGLLRDLGARVAINPDAHDVAGIDDLSYGLLMARKALLPAALVINTLEPEAWLRR